jgi:hypothetical protein
MASVIASKADIWSSVEMAFRGGMLERLGDVSLRLPEVRGLIQVKEECITDCDAYQRKVGLRCVHARCVHARCVDHATACTRARCAPLC